MLGMVPNMRTPSRAHMGKEPGKERWLQFFRAYFYVTWVVFV